MAEIPNSWNRTPRDGGDGSSVLPGVPWAGRDGGDGSSVLPGVPWAGRDGGDGSSVLPGPPWTGGLGKTVGTVPTVSPSAPIVLPSARGYAGDDTEPLRTVSSFAQGGGDTLARSTAALRRARSEYVARHDPPPETPRRPQRWAVSRRLGLAAAGVVALVATAVGLRTGTSVAGSAVDLGTPSPPAVVESVPNVVVVHVVGAVVRPGVFVLAGGSRVADAVEAAGGATDEADLAALNLARPLVDGEQLYVPLPGEVVPGAPGGPAVVDDGRVDLNNATQSELETLPGVGPVIAGRIIDGRPFASVDSLEKVSGIGPATMARLRDLVKV